MNTHCEHPAANATRTSFSNGCWSVGTHRMIGQISCRRATRIGSKLKLKLDLHPSDVPFLGLKISCSHSIRGIQRAGLRAMGCRFSISTPFAFYYWQKAYVKRGLLQFHPLSLPRIDDGYADRLIGRSVARRHDEPSRGRNRGDVAVRCWESSPAGL